MHNLNIIVPVYNEQESLKRFKEKMDDFLAVSPFKTSILFVNDGSTDDSYTIIQSICRTDIRYHCISLLKNSGLSAAIKAGIDNSKSPWIGYIDADLQTSPLDFMKYLDYINDYVMINGIRTNRKDKLIKRLSSKIANGFRRMVIKDHIADTCCPLKLMRADYAKRIPFFDGMHRFIPALIQLQGGKVKQLPVHHFERYAGTPKYSLTNRLTGPFFDTLAFVWMRKRYINYQVQKQQMITSYKSERVNA